MRLSRKGSWSLIMKRFPSSFQGWLRTREGLPWSKARKVGPWPRYAFRIQHGTISWSWMGQPSHGTPPLRSSRKGMLTTSLTLLLLPKDNGCSEECETVDLFLSLKRDLVLVSFSTCLNSPMLGYLSLI